MVLADERRNFSVAVGISTRTAEGFSSLLTRSKKKIREFSYISLDLCICPSLAL